MADYFYYITISFLICICLLAVIAFIRNSNRLSSLKIEIEACKDCLKRNEQISLIFKAQTNTDILWVNFNTNTIVSTGDFNFFKSMKFVPDLSGVRISDVNEYFGIQLQSILNSNQNDSDFFECEVELNLLDKKKNYIKCYIKDLTNDEYIFYVVDITDIKEKESRLIHNASTDFLTGLLMRRAMTELIEKERVKIEQDKKQYISIIDIDFFKDINDRFGHDIGDLVLKTIGGILLDQEDFKGAVSRWGGEEFLIFFKCKNYEEAETRIIKLIKEISDKNISFYGKSINVTVTSGVAELQEGQTYDDCIRRADIALYSGKTSGRNCVKLYENLI